MPAILLVEDDPHMLRSLERLLLENGFEVVTCSSGKEAIEAAQKREFALIITDVRMPGIDGLEALGKVGVFQPSARKLVITGYAGDDAPIRAIQLSVDGYLMKPFNPDVLLRNVEAALSRYQHEKERSEMLRGASRSVLEALALVVKRIQSGMPGRLERVQGIFQWSSRVASSLGLSPPQIETLEKAVQLHDLGLLPGQDPARHGQSASELLKQVGGMEEVARVLDLHHEPFDLKEEGLPVEARVLAAVEGYHELRSDQAAEALLAGSGKVYDPEIIEAFTDLLLNPDHAPRKETLKPEIPLRSHEVLLHLAQVYNQAGDLETAWAALQKLLEQESSVPQADLRSRLHLALADHHVRGGNIQEAHAEGEKALEIALSESLPAPFLAEAFLAIALSRLFLSRYEKLEDLLEKARETFARSGDHRNLARAELYQALYWLAVGKSAEADTAVQRCLKLMEDHRFQDLPVSEPYLFKLPNASSLLSLLNFAPVTEEKGIKVCSLGPFRVFRSGQLIKEEAWKSKKAKILLAYLLFNMDKAVSEERLCDLFWPNTDPERSRKNLHHVVYLLRRTLEPGLEDGNLSRYILSQRNTYRFNPEAEFSWDMAEFRKELDAAQKLLASRQEQKAASRVSRLETLYVGDLLEDYPEATWCDFERQKLKDSYLNFLLELADCHEKEGRHAMALDLASRVLIRDPLREKAAIQQIRTLYKAGQRSEAMRRYQTWTEELKEELGLSPSPELTALHREMTGGPKASPEPDRSPRP